MCLYTNSLPLSLILTKLSNKTGQHTNLSKFILNMITLYNKTKSRVMYTFSVYNCVNTHFTQQDLFSYSKYFFKLQVNTELVQHRVCIGCKPIQDILLVLCNPLHVGHGPLNGLVQRQGPRTKTNVSIVCLELLQLLQKVKHEMFREVVQPFEATKNRKDPNVSVVLKYHKI